MPTEAAREGLGRRIQAIDAWHQPASIEAIRPHIDLLLGTVQIKNEDGEDIEVRKRAYYLTMADQPLYAVAEACLEALRGNVGDSKGKWCPKPGELHIAARKATEALRQERLDISRILEAKPLDDDQSAEHRARMKANFAALTADLAERKAMAPHYSRVNPDRNMKLPSVFDDARKPRDPTTPVTAPQELREKING